LQEEVATRSSGKLTDDVTPVSISGSYFFSEEEPNEETKEEEIVFEENPTEAVDLEETSLDPAAPNPAAKPKANMPPTAPKMGGLSIEDPVTPWTGGKPKVDWDDGLEQAPAFVHPNMARPAHPKYKQDAWARRVTGRTSTFGRKDDLVQFSKDVMDHLETNGMDSITYLLEPSSGERVSVVENFPRFANHAVDKLHEQDDAKWDEHDLTNDLAAREYLLNSLEAKFKASLQLKIPKNSAFVVYWMTVVKMVRSSALDVYDKIKNKIRERKPSDYNPGENIERMTTDIRADCETLEKANQFDPSLLSAILEGLLLAGDRNINFMFKLMELRSKLRPALLHISALKDKDEIQQYLESKDLTYQDICSVAEDAYNEERDENRWGPAKHKTDSNRVPARFAGAAAAVDGTPLTKQEVLALIHQAQGGNSNNTKGTRTGNCNNCGQSGHWRRKCPHLETGKPKAFQPQQDSRNRDSNSNNGTNPRHRQPSNTNNGKRPGSSNNPPKTSWRYTPPKPDSSQTTMRDGKKYYWCGECKRYTTSHLTEAHGKNSPAPQASLAMRDPSAWFASGLFDEEEQSKEGVSSWWKQVGKFVFAIWAYLALFRLLISTANIAKAAWSASSYLWTAFLTHGTYLAIAFWSLLAMAAILIPTVCPDEQPFTGYDDPADAFRNRRSRRWRAAQRRRAKQPCHVPARHGFRSRPVPAHTRTEINKPLSKMDVLNLTFSRFARALTSHLYLPVRCSEGENAQTPAKKGPSSMPRKPRRYRNTRSFVPRPLRSEPTPMSDRVTG
jgi:hypothetical protein